MRLLSRRWLVHGADGKPRMLVASGSMLELREAVPSGETVHAYEAPDVSVTETRGQKRPHLVGSQHTPAWWVRVYDRGSPGGAASLRCRTRRDAEAIAQWAHEHYPQYNK